MRIVRPLRDAPKTLDFPMRYLGSKRFVGIAFLVLGISSVAEAQMGPGMGGGGMGGGGMGGPTQPAGEEKKEGVAEAAPKTPGLLPTTPALPAPKGRRKRWKLLELDGYFRMRSEWQKNFNLGFNDDASNPMLGGAPYNRPLDCFSPTLNHPCGDTLTGSNLRLRLEPTINLDEGTSIHVQADVLDNMVLGSTPNPYNLSGIYTTANKPPLGAFTSTQAPQIQGVNSIGESIVIKRAWAEVAVPLGIIKVGRMPNQWGMGIIHNAGGYDPVSNTYNYDADVGDSVDRASFTAQIPGTQLRVMVGMDWDSTMLTSSQSTANAVAPLMPNPAVSNNAYAAQPFDLDNSADTTGWVGAISKMDSAQDFRDAVDRGETVLNYGVYFEYKSQDWAEDLTTFKLGGAFDPTRFVPRTMKLYSPDLWGKLGVGSFTLEGELAGQFGSVQTLTDLGLTGTATIRKFGGVGKFTWRGVENKLRMGVETGFATGDQWDNTPEGNTNIAYANLLGDPSICNAQHSCTLTQFIFNPSYFVDDILWRRLVGAVTNAVYLKPFLEYDLTKSITFKVANITSFALNEVATPGNGNVYGTEFDTDIGYHDGRIYAGLSYGILFPFDAMAHPPFDDLAGGPGFNAPNGWGSDVNGNPNSGDPGTAHTIRARLVLTFSDPAAAQRPVKAAGAATSIMSPVPSWPATFQPQQYQRPESCAQ